MRILMAGGGTAGSVTPLLALIKPLRQKDPNIEFLFIGTVKGIPERRLVESAHIPYVGIPAGKLRRYLSVNNISDIVYTIRGWRAAKTIIRSFRPDALIVCGSYVGVPVGLASHFAKVPVAIHQQDLRPGLANRILAPIADMITVAFEQSTQDFSHRKTHWIGNPVREELLHGTRAQGVKTFNLDPDYPTLLIIGGSAGAEYINTILGDVIEKIMDIANVIHITGTNRPPSLFQHRRYRAEPFLNGKLANAYASADVVLCRAGLGTLSELAVLSKASIIIPMPGTHQEDTARFMNENKGAIVLRQHQMTLDLLVTAVSDLIQDVSKRERIGNALHNLIPNGTMRLTELLWALINSSSRQ